MEKGQIFALALIFGLVGCATGSSRSVRQASFVEAEYAPYREKGTASISAQAFMQGLCNWHCQGNTQAAANTYRRPKIFNVSRMS